MLEEFVTLDFVLSFAGMVIIVGILTQFTKTLIDKIVSNSTKYVVYAWTFLLCCFAAWQLGTWTNAATIIVTIFLWFLNSVFVWLSAMKAYDMTTGK